MSSADVELSSIVTLGKTPKFGSTLYRALKGELPIAV
jgi:hypothetical protein